MDEKKRSFWERLFGSSYPSEREQKVREYISHRIGEGAHLWDVLQEEYVRRNASHVEIDEILDDPALIEAAHKHMVEDFSSGKLAPTPPPSAGQQKTRFWSASTF